MCKLFRRLLKREDGTTAIEFSLLAIPYFLVSLGIIELSIMYASASLLEGATSSAARLVRTGQVQQAAGDPQEMFSDAICSYATVLIDCTAVQTEVVQMDSFTDYDNLGPSFDEDGNLVSQGFTPGGSNDRVLIRVAYRYTMMTPFIGRLLAPEGGRTFMSTIVLQTEPYEFGGGV